MREIKNTRQIVTESSTFCFDIDSWNGLEIENGEITCVFTGDWRSGGTFTKKDDCFESECKDMIKRFALQDNSELRNMYRLLSSGKMKDLCKRLLEIEDI